MAILTIKVMTSVDYINIEISAILSDIIYLLHDIAFVCHMIVHDHEIISVTV